MKAFQFPKQKTIKHSIIWAIVLIYLATFAPYTGKAEARAIAICIILLKYIFTYYFLSLFLFKKYYLQPLKLTIGLVLSLIVFCLIQLLVHYFIMPLLGGQSTFTTNPVWKSIINIILAFFINALASYSAYNHNLSIRRLEIQAENEKLLIVKELIFLRNQFHSDFTFNFIKYCYHKVNEASEIAAHAISLFSKLLEYSMSVKQNERVVLQREIDFIRDYIALQKILSTNLFITLNCEGSFKDKFITSRILITFVENAIKHGITNDSSHPIIINLNSKNSVIHFSVQNKINTHNKVLKTGIGQQNAKQYLELFYSKQYKLIIKNSLDSYLCNLTLSV